jgi:two-component system, chemotaxis family, protein-glutamate methylesterase/glutaminase
VISFRERLSLSGIVPPSDALRMDYCEDVMAQRPPQVSAAPSSDLVVIAGSSGGVDALRTICLALPADFPGTIAIVQHRTAAHGHLLAELMATWTTLPVFDATAGALLASGAIYVAPPDQHMTITCAHTVALTHGSPIHHLLSSADPLFESAALAYEDRLTAVILTGHDGDGAAGVVAVRRHGGTTIVQDPDHAECGEMPRSAIATGAVDRILPLSEIAGALVSRVREPMASGRERPVGSP